MFQPVCVIIAAKNAAHTIGIAVQSAMLQPEVGRVIVVDDDSDDNTAHMAQKACEADQRLLIIRLSQNMGPSHARNVGIAASTEPLIAILDADDSFLPNRFSALLSQTDWDLIADDIAFVSQPNTPVPLLADTRSFSMDVARFIAGNISKDGVERGEYGFLKPVVRRSFLEQHALAYNENLWLGEDYDLYVRMLLAGANFKVVGNCGYRALVRASSLSGQHSTLDLQKLAMVDRALLQRGDLSQETERALNAHLRQVEDKFLHRRFLDRRRSDGLIAAITELRKNPSALMMVLRAIWRDKTAKQGDSDKGQGVRYLLR